LDKFGHALSQIGDLDGDGIMDLAVGAERDDDGGKNRGAFYILFLNNDGTVKSFQKISDTQGGFLGKFNNNDFFGHYIDNMGDLNGDGITDLGVGAKDDDDGGKNRGAFYILFMDNDGTVKNSKKISDTKGGFGQLGNNDWFGKSVVSIGDLDNDGIVDFGVGAHGDDDGCPNTYKNCDKGAVYVLFMKNDGTVKSEQKISDDGGFTGNLDEHDAFGYSVGGRLGDLDGDGVVDLVVGAYEDDDGGIDRGALYILFLNNDGTVKSFQKISDTEGGFSGALDDEDHFAHALSPIGDLDGDGIMDLAVGAEHDDDGGINNLADRGAVWILFLNSDGTVKSFQKISDTQGGFEGILDDGDIFGHRVHPIGDLDGDGITEIAVGAHKDDDGGKDRGAVYILFMNSDGTVKSFQKISDTQGGFEGIFANDDRFCIEEFENAHQEYCD